MKGFKKLTVKEIKRRHASNPKDKKLQKIIENNQVDKQVFNKLIKESAKHKPFDNKR